ncbi:MAG: histidine phosphatase family protein [Ferruginibacter sp.]|nr:histidine phosphatase family protein [Ferruginibacter sp.]
MKTLLLIRHAKSSWATIGQLDFDRNLNERGLKDANAMAKRLLQHNFAVSKFISSPAKRTSTTCSIFANAYNSKKEDIIFVEKLYNAPEYVFAEIVQNLVEGDNVVAIFAHNPGITNFVNKLCKNVQIDNMPTCGIFAVQAAVKTWKEFITAEKDFLFFKYPKEV